MTRQLMLDPLRRRSEADDGDPLYLDPKAIEMALTTAQQALHLDPFPSSQMRYAGSGQGLRRLAASLAAVRAISASVSAVATRVCSMFSVPALLAERLVLPFASPRLLATKSPLLEAKRGPSASVGTIWEASQV
jgi:hypothetical protein